MNLFFQKQICTKLLFENGNLQQTLLLMSQGLSTIQTGPQGLHLD